MSKNIYNVSLLDIMPQSLLSDPFVAAMAKSMDPELQGISAEIIKCILLPRIGDLPEEVVDLLAWQFHVDFYEPSLDINKKRSLVRNSITWHRKKGTPAVVESLATEVFGSGEVLEWWEYGGNPYHFKILTTEDFGEMARFKRALYTVKNLRSRLEAIVFRVNLEYSTNLRQKILIQLKNNINFWTPYDTQLTFNGIVNFDGTYLFSGNRHGPKHLTLMRRKMFCGTVNELNNIAIVSANINAASTISSSHGHFMRIYLFARPGRAANFSGLLRFDGAINFDRLFVRNTVTFCRRVFNTSAATEPVQKALCKVDIATINQIPPTSHNILIRKILRVGPSRAANFGGTLKFNGISDFNSLLILSTVTFCRRVPISSKPEVAQRTLFQVDLTSTNHLVVSHATDMKKVFPAASGQAANFSGRLRFDGASNFDRTLTKQPAALRIYRNDILTEEVAV